MENCSRWGRGTRVQNADLGKSTLLSAALHCLATKGFRTVTMQDVAEAASVSRRTVYRYFSGKDEMLREVVTFSQEQAFEVMEREAQPYRHDFFAFFEQAVVTGVDHYLKMDAATKAAVSSNHRYIQAYADYDLLIRRWKRLLRTPYQQYLQANPDAKLVGMLDTYAELATLIVTGHCQLRSPESSIRKSFANILSLSEQGERPWHQQREWS